MNEADKNYYRLKGELRKASIYFRGLIEWEMDQLNLLDRINYELYSDGSKAGGVERAIEIVLPVDCCEPWTLISSAITEDLFGWNTSYYENPSRALRSAVKGQMISIHELNFNVRFCDRLELSATVSYSSTPSEEWLKQLINQCQIEFRKACLELAIDLLESADPAAFTAELRYNPDLKVYEAVSNNGQEYFIGFAWKECGVTEIEIIKMVQKGLQPEEILIQALKYSPFKKWSEDLSFKYF